MPDAADVAVTLAVTHLAKSASQMQRRTRGIRGHHLRLHGPIAFAFGRGDQTCEQRAAQAMPLGTRGDVDADLSDAGRASSIWNRRQCRPSGDAPFAIARDEPSCLQVAAIPAFPLRRTGGECCKARTQPLGVNPPHFRPVAFLHRLNSEFQ